MSEKTSEITSFLGGREGQEETGLLKHCKKGCQETKSTCYRYTTDFQVKKFAILAPPLLENRVNVALQEPET